MKQKSLSRKRPPRLKGLFFRDERCMYGTLGERDYVKQEVGRGVGKISPRGSASAGAAAPEPGDAGSSGSRHHTHDLTRRQMDSLWCLLVQEFV